MTIMERKAKIRTVNASYLIKSHNVDASAEIDVLGVQTIDPFLLESLLSKGIVSREGGRKHRIDNECKNVQTVEKTLSECALNKALYRYSPYR